MYDDTITKNNNITVVALAMTKIQYKIRKNAKPEDHKKYLYMYIFFLSLWSSIETDTLTNQEQQFISMITDLERADQIVPIWNNLGSEQYSLISTEKNRKGLSL